MEGEASLEVEASKLKILASYQAAVDEIDLLEGIDESHEEQLEKMKTLDAEYLMMKSKVLLLEKKLRKVESYMTNKIDDITLVAQLECGDEL